jgi:hypothetical protein
MTTKTLDTLIGDIHSVFSDSSHKINEDYLNLFLEGVKTEVVKALEESGQHRELELRMSNIGRPERFLWFEINRSRESKTPSQLPLETRIKFLMGHVMEHLVLFLAREAGHSVTDQQKEIEVDGIKGHMDAKIDGVPVDVKTASGYSFKKFVEGEVLSGGEKDPFGYMGQISGYSEAEGATEAAFLPINKETGELAILPVHSMNFVDVRSKIKSCKYTVSQPTPPVKKCYDPVPEGKSGNMTIHRNCTFCTHKFECWKGEVRAFKYSDGIKLLTSVVKTPSVEEVELV